ncbi:MAG: ATP phosphoribosyltransferase, partial [Campylobacteraceae bacterium]|nr:ATP phosphoribosyltransferase [Campylobacteraceae bacterium]
GILGFDVLAEKDCTALIKLLDLKIGRCDICIGIPNDKEINYMLPEIKVATKMENITRQYFSSKAISVDIIKLYGSIELAPIVGLADAMVDLVETGDTMRQNGLKVVETIGSSTAHLVSNKLSYISNKTEILNLLDSIRATYDNS